MNNKKLKIHKDHIRTQFIGIGSLKSSIEKDGLIEPIIVDKDGNVVGGARRFKALGKKIKKDDIRIVESGDILRRQLIMELNRSDLNPMDLARALKKYQTRTKQSGRQCAKDLGIGYSFFRRSRKLVELPLEIQKQIYDGIVAPNSDVIRTYFKKNISSRDEWCEFSRDAQYLSIINSLTRIRTRVETSNFNKSDFNSVIAKLDELSNWVKLINKNRNES